MDEFENLMEALMQMRQASATSYPSDEQIGGMDEAALALLELQMMRQGSGGALGQVPPDEIEHLTRKRLSPERIHNLGALYGKPINQEQLDYFENQLNRDPNESYFGNYPDFPMG